MRFSTIVILFIVSLPIAYASFDCSLTSNPQECNNILSENITPVQQDQLFSSLIYNSINIPDYNSILQYNTKIKVNASIANITNSIYIKDAWLSLLTISPSIIENNTLYIPDVAFVLSDYNYRIEVPENYNAQNYPETKNGDCKIIYNLIINNSALNILVNNQNQGNIKFNPITIHEDAVIKDQLEINSNIKQEHYGWKKYCAKERRGVCIQYTYKCEYTSTSNLQDKVILTDALTVKHYGKRPIVNVNTITKNYNTHQIIFTAENSDTFNINFNNSSYTEQKYVYSIEFIKKPFYFAVLKAEKVNIKKTNNLLAGLNNTFFLKDITNCKIIAFNHFYNINVNCNINSVQQEEKKYEIVPFTYDLLDFFRLGVFVFIIYFVYRIIRHFIVNGYTF